MSAAPTAYILAGPNGAGKTSLYHFEAADVPRLNGDTRYQQSQNQYAVEAALREQLTALLAARASFVIETNAASERDYALFASLKKQGYRIELRYVGLPTPADCRERVIQRVAEGGHDVPAALIEQRYQNSLSLLKRHYRAFDRLQFYDNSGTEPVEFAELIPDTPLQLVAPTPDWAAPLLAHISWMEDVYRKLPPASE